MRLTLIRHGESEGNAAGTLQGFRLDMPLSARGRRQAEALAIRLLSGDVDRVYASPLRRSRETAEVVALPHGVGVSVDVDLVEFDWGAWTGRPLADELEVEVEELRRRWRAGEADASPPGGESPRKAAARAARFLERLRGSGWLAPVVVAHGRFNRVMMAVLLGRDLARMDEIKQRNGSVSVFQLEGDGPAKPVLLDDVSHLAGDLLSTLGGSDSLK